MTNRKSFQRTSTELVRTILSDERAVKDLLKFNPGLRDRTTPDAESPES